MNEERLKKVPVLISACLLGVSCKYSGGDNCMNMELLEELKNHCQLVPVCPEQLGGLTTPRQPSEVCGSRVCMKNGTDVTLQYEKGACEALYLAQLFGCRCAILKARSPSCGSGEIYDGTFSGTLISGDGKTAELLKKHGIRVYTEQEVMDRYKLTEPAENGKIQKGFKENDKDFDRRG